MADHIFSAARLKGYRVLEDAGLGDAATLHILNTVVAAQLWLPISLIEVGFRNAVDGALTAAHDRDEEWLIADGRQGATLFASRVVGAAGLRREIDGGGIDDPVEDAARRAALHLNRDEISRDDLIAHLMLGFWVARVPEAFEDLDPFALVSARRAAPFNDPRHLRGVMRSDVNDTRNRIAHHEPILFRGKHVFDDQGAAKVPIALADSLLGALEKFAKRVGRIADAAKAFAPMAAGNIDTATAVVDSALEPLREHLQAQFAQLRAENCARRAAKRNGH
jgi:hypothetical protein